MPVKYDMTIDETIEYLEKIAKHQLECAEKLDELGCDSTSTRSTVDYHKQLVEWLRELKAYREFAEWLVKAVLEEDWEESADFYAEVLCRKLTKLGKLKVVDNKYMGANADEDSD